MLADLEDLDSDELEEIQALLYSKIHYISEETTSLQPVDDNIIMSQTNGPYQPVRRYFEGNTPHASRNLSYTNPNSPQTNADTFNLNQPNNFNPEVKPNNPFTQSNPNDVFTQSNPNDVFTQSNPNDVFTQSNPNAFAQPHPVFYQSNIPLFQSMIPTPINNIIVLPQGTTQIFNPQCKSTRNQKRRLAKKALKTRMDKIAKAATEDAELFRGLSHEERRSVFKYQKRQRYLERKQMRKIQKEQELVDNYNTGLSSNNFYNSPLAYSSKEPPVVNSDTVIEPVIGINEEKSDIVSLSGSDSSCIALEVSKELLIISDDDDPVGVPITTTEVEPKQEKNEEILLSDDGDDVVFVELNTPTVIDLDPEADVKRLTDSELMKPPSDFETLSVSSLASINLSGELKVDAKSSTPTKAQAAAKEREELLSTPESSNDFLDNSIPVEQSNFNFSLHGSDFNTSKDTGKSKTLRDVYESESSCSASDVSAPVKTVVFSEIEFDSPTKRLFDDNNLDRFIDFITPKRVTVAMNIPRILTPTREVFEQIPTKAGGLNSELTSDSSSESEYGESKVAKVGKKLPELSHFDTDRTLKSDNKSESGKKKKKKKIPEELPETPKERKRKKNKGIDSDGTNKSDDSESKPKKKKGKNGGSSIEGSDGEVGRTAKTKRKKSKEEEVVDSGGKRSKKKKRVCDEWIEDENEMVEPSNPEFVEVEDSVLNTSTASESSVKESRKIKILSNSVIIPHEVNSDKKGKKNNDEVLAYKKSRTKLTLEEDETEIKQSSKKNRKSGEKLKKLALMEGENKKEKKFMPEDECAQEEERKNRKSGGKQKKSIKENDPDDENSGSRRKNKKLKKLTEEDNLEEENDSEGRKARKPKEKLKKVRRDNDTTQDNNDETDGKRRKSKKSGKLCTEDDADEVRKNKKSNDKQRTCTKDEGVTEEAIEENSSVTEDVTEVSIEENSAVTDGRKYKKSKLKKDVHIDYGEELTLKKPWKEDQSKKSRKSSEPSAEDGAVKIVDKSSQRDHSANLSAELTFASVEKEIVEVVQTNEQITENEIRKKPAEEESPKKRRTSEKSIDDESSKKTGEKSVEPESDKKVRRISEKSVDESVDKTRKLKEKDAESDFPQKTRRISDGSITKTRKTSEKCIADVGKIVEQPDEQTTIKASMQVTVEAVTSESRKAVEELICQPAAEVKVIEETSKPDEAGISKVLEREEISIEANANKKSSTQADDESIEIWNKQLLEHGLILTDLLGEKPARYSDISEPSDVEESAKPAVIVVELDKSDDSDVEIIEKSPELIVIDGDDDGTTETKELYDVKSIGRDVESRNSSSSSNYHMSDLELVGGDLELVNLESDRPRFSNNFSKDMHTFYQNSWNVENYSLANVQKEMRDDPALWKILERDRVHIRLEGKRGPRCNRCRQLGHIAVHCPNKVGPPKCSLCGNSGHMEPRCPNKLCTQCGRRGMDSTVFCSKCAYLRKRMCTLCKMTGHEPNNCPDLWRRYHLTVAEGPIVTSEANCLKRRRKLWCSGCSRSGHLEHECNYYGRTHPPTWPLIIEYEELYGFPKHSQSSEELDSTVSTDEQHNLSVTVSIDSARQPPEIMQIPTVSLNVESNTRTVIEQTVQTSRDDLINECVLFTARQAATLRSNRGQKFLARLENKYGLTLKVDVDPILSLSCIRILSTLYLSLKLKNEIMRFVHGKDRIECAKSYFKLKQHLELLASLQPECPKKLLEQICQEGNAKLDKYVRLNTVLFGMFRLKQGNDRINFLKKTFLKMHSTRVVKQPALRKINAGISYVFLKVRTIEEYRQLIALAESEGHPVSKESDYTFTNSVEETPQYMSLSTDVGGYVELVPLHPYPVGKFTDNPLCMRYLDDLRAKVWLKLVGTNFKLSGDKEWVVESRIRLKCFLKNLVQMDNFSSKINAVWRTLIEGFAHLNVWWYLENIPMIYKKTCQLEKCLVKKFTSNGSKMLSRYYLKLNALFFGKYKIGEGAQNMDVLLNWANNVPVADNNIICKTPHSAIKQAYFYIFDSNRKNIDYQRIIVDLKEELNNQRADNRVEAGQNREKYILENLQKYEHLAREKNDYVKIEEIELMKRACCKPKCIEGAIRYIEDLKQYFN